MGRVLGFSGDGLCLWNCRDCWRAWNLGRLVDIDVLVLGNQNQMIGFCEKHGMNITHPSCVMCTAETLGNLKEENARLSAELKQAGFCEAHYPMLDGSEPRCPCCVAIGEVNKLEQELAELKGHACENP